MLDAARLEFALIAAARRYAPALIPPAWAGPGTLGDLAAFASRLADEGTLILGAQPTTADDPTAVKTWGEAYSALALRVCQALFPSFVGVSVVAVDAASPPIAAFSAVCPPAIAAIGAIIAPYAAARAGTHPSDLEVRGVVELLLEALEAGDLPREAYASLREECAAMLRRLLAVPVRTIAIAKPARAIAASVGAMPAPSAPAAPLTSMPPSMPPANLPETPAPPPGLPESAPAPAPAFRADAVPIFFDPARRPDDGPPPAVPPLPR